MDPYAKATEFLFQRGFGVDIRTVAQYRKGIESVPGGLLADDTDLSLLTLADPRPGLLRSCKFLGIKFQELGYIEDSAEPFDENFPLPTEPSWFRHDDGCANLNRRPDECRDELKGDIQAGSAMEGIFAYAHHPQIIKEGEHVLDLPRTVHRGARVLCACLEVWHGRARLFLFRDSDLARPHYGALRLRRK